MIGLMLKDLLSLKKAGGKMVIILGLYTVIFASTGGITFLSAMIIMILTMLVMNTFSYDELSKWDYYALSLPVAKQQIVLSKYLLSLFLNLIGILISLAVYVVKKQVNLESAFSLCALSCTALLMASVLLPLLFKLGTQKARIWMILIFLLPTAGIMALSSLGIKLSGNSLAAISDSTIELLVYLAVPAAFILFAVSYLVSCHIFKNKKL